MKILNENIKYKIKYFYVILFQGILITAVIDCGALHCVRNFLENGDLKIKKETCWMLSNILADSTNHVQEVISIGILPLLVKNLSSGDFKIRKEVISNIFISKDSVVFLRAYYLQFSFFF